jgi:hypothetical protein
MFTVATNASTVGIATFMLQDLGGLQHSVNGRESRIQLSTAAPALRTNWRLWPYTREYSLGGVTLKVTLSSLL